MCTSTLAIRCRYCSAVVGKYDEKDREQGHVLPEYYPPVRCKGVHPEPKRDERVFFGGMIREVRIVYPETKTEESWYEYIGPPTRFSVWLAIQRVNGRGLRVGEHVIYWSPIHGFFGKGYADLFLS